MSARRCIRACSRAVARRWRCSAAARSAPTTSGRPRRCRRPTRKRRAGGAVWLPAAPADALDRGDWWTPVRRPGARTRSPRGSRSSNQNVAAAVAPLRAGAGAGARSSARRCFPTVSARTASARRAAAARGTAAGRRPTPSPSRSAPTGRPTSGAGSRRGVESARAERAGERRRPRRRRACRRRASSRSTTSRCARPTPRSTLLDATIEGYERALQITQNRYDAGIVAADRRAAGRRRSSPTTRADAGGAARQRARFEHAIAVLVGAAPGDFALAAGRLERRSCRPCRSACRRRCCSAGPTSPSAERAVAAANAQIGIAALGLLSEPRRSSGIARQQREPRLGDLFSASSALWSLGVSVAQTVFDAGATGARVEGAEAGARGRRRALPPDRADRLPGRRGPAQRPRARWPSRPSCAAQASDAADQTEQQILNRYRAGQVSYTEVVTAQASALSARRALVQVGGRTGRSTRDRADPGARRRLGAYRNTLGAGRRPSVRIAARPSQERATRWKRPG